MSMEHFPGDTLTLNSLTEIEVDLYTSCYVNGINMWYLQAKNADNRPLTINMNVAIIIARENEGMSQYDLAAAFVILPDHVGWMWIPGTWDDGEDK